MVSPERQIWHCFGCGQGGDIFKFVMQMEGVEFPDALRILARRAGVVLKRQDPQIQSRKKRLYEVCELAAKFFQAQLAKGSGGQPALKYLKERGLKEETIKSWRLGWAPDNWRALTDFLKSRGYRVEEIIAAGLAIKPEKESAANNPYDRFRSRIMFPIFDLLGQAVGFAGRIFGQKEKEDVGKYINTPQTELYDKSRLLYGLNFAKNEIRQADAAVFVEGNLDVIMSHQAGVKNAVASSGTALTEEHLRIIKRYTDNLLFAFDADAAGQTATRRGIDLALAQDFQIKMIKLKDKDPAEVIKKNPADWQQSLAAAQSIKDFYFGSVAAKFDVGTEEGRRAIKKELLPIIKSLASRTEQSEWLKELSRLLRANERDLMFDLEKTRPAIDRQPADLTPEALPKQAHSRLDWLEERLLGLCLNHPQHWPQVADIGALNMENKNLAQIFYQLKSLAGETKNEDLMDRLKKNLSSELNIQVDYLSLKIQQQPAEELEIIKEMELCLRELKIIKIRQNLLSLSFDIQKAQTQNNHQEITPLLEKFSQLAGQLIELTKNQ